MPNTTVLNMEDVFNVLLEIIEKRRYNVECFGYDPYNADRFVELWKIYNGTFGIEVVRQGVRTESVPLGEIKKLSSQRKLVFDESIFSFAMGNCMVLVDNNGNSKLYKRRYEHKIDPVAALLDAYVVYVKYQELFK